MIAHWDELPKRRAERGPMAATWTDLGGPAGSSRAGARRIEIGEGEIPTPAHVHGQAEEIFYVLGGSGLSWQDGKAYEVRTGDCIVHRNSHEAHTLRGGRDGLDVVAFGEREYLPTGSLPRAGVAWFITGWIDVRDEGHPWEREPAFEFSPPERERPPTIVALEQVESEVRRGRRRRDLGRAAGSRFTGLKHLTLEPGTLSAPPHCHSDEEELFVVLEGEGTLELTPSPAAAAAGAVPEHHDVRRGHLVARPPGTGVAHAFRAGEPGLTLLAWGTRRPNDIAYYPRSQKLFWRGAGVVARVEHVDYWDGEEL